MDRGLENMKHDGLVLGIGTFISMLILENVSFIIVDHDKVGEQFLTELGFPAGKRSPARPEVIEM